MATKDAQKTSSFGQRFRQWREAQGVSGYRIAKITGINPSFISNVEADRRPMSNDFMRRLAQIPELNITYETLRSWKIQANYDPTEVQQAFQSIAGGGAAKKKSKSDQVTPIDGLYRIPLKMTVSAGALKEKALVEEPVYIDWYGLQSVDTDLFAAQVKGDSMWPPIPDGAMLLVREVEDLKNGEKYIIETEDNTMTFKLIKFDKKGANLVPLNESYKPIPLGDAKMKKLYQVLSYKVDWS